MALKGSGGAIGNAAITGGTIADVTLSGVITLPAANVSGGTYTAGTTFTGNTATGFGVNASNFALWLNDVIRMNVSAGDIRIPSDHRFSWSSATNNQSSTDTSIARAAANSVIFGAGTSATTTSRTEINKAVTAFTNAAAKATFTVTVPNAAHNATIEFRVMGALGAGGAIGAGEAMATNTYVIGIVRTAGVATVATATAAFGAVAVAVAGAATVTATAAVSAMSGAVGATQTFTIDVTISRSGGSSDNHTAMCYAKLLNANATGITIA